VQTATHAELVAHHYDAFKEVNTAPYNLTKGMQKRQA